MQQLPLSTVKLLIEIAALRYACAKALSLLQDGDAEAKDADRVEKLLETVLKG